MQFISFRDGIWIALLIRMNLKTCRITIYSIILSLSLISQSFAATTSVDTNGRSLSLEDLRARLISLNGYQKLNSDEARNFNETWSKYQSHFSEGNLSEKLQNSELGNKKQNFSKPMVFDNFKYSKTFDLGKKSGDRYFKVSSQLTEERNILLSAELKGRKQSQKLELEKTIELSNLHKKTIKLASKIRLLNSLDAAFDKHIPTDERKESIERANKLIMKSIKAKLIILSHQDDLSTKSPQLLYRNLNIDISNSTREIAQEIRSIQHQADSFHKQIEDNFDLKLNTSNYTKNFLRFSAAIAAVSFAISAGVTGVPLAIISTAFIAAPLAFTISFLNKYLKESRNFSEMKIKASTKLILDTLTRNVNTLLRKLPVEEREQIRKEINEAGKHLPKNDWNVGSCKVSI